MHLSVKFGIIIVWHPIWVSVTIWEILDLLLVVYVVTRYFSLLQVMIFSRKRFNEALEMFNLSVMFAPFPKETNCNNMNHTSSSEPGREQPELEKPTDKNKECKNLNDGEIKNHTEANTIESPLRSSSLEKSAQKGSKWRNNQQGSHVALCRALFGYLKCAKVSKCPNIKASGCVM